jgi:hypothetical protein
VAYGSYTGAPDDEQERVSYLMQLFQYARQQRFNFEVQWEESASLVWPEYRNSFSFGHVRSPGVKYTQYQVDSTAAIKAWRFMAIADALVTPSTMLWSQFRSSDPELMKVREAKIYYEQLTKCIWAERYRATANFQTQQQTNWQALAVFGNQGMLIEEYDARPERPDKGLRYIGTAPGEIYILQNHQGRVDGFIRHFRWTARQAYQKWGMKIPPALAAAAEKNDVYTLFDFLQFVIPRTDYDPMMIFSNQGKPWSSTYLSVVGYSILEEGGYYSFPLAHGRYMQAVEEWYGRGPAQQVLPELKTKNAEKETFLKQGKLAGDPTYLLPEDGLFDFKAESGSYNYGAMSEDGKPLVATLPTGNIQITKELMQDSDAIIDSAFLTDLFPMLFKKDNQQRSAREVIEVANQMGIFLAPTLGRQYGEFLHAEAMRVHNVLKVMRKLPPMPDVVKEAKAGTFCRFTSPLARALEGQGIAGYMRSVEMTAQIANSSQDQSVWDMYDFDTAIPEMAEDQYAPARWFASPKMIGQKRQSRAKQQAQESYVKALPGLAARDKAAAITAKAQSGGNIGGTLSGTPQGGMPIVPGNNPGQPGQPGVFGGPGQSGQPGQ